MSSLHKLEDNRENLPTPHCQSVNVLMLRRSDPTYIPLLIGRCIVSPESYWHKSILPTSRSLDFFLLASLRPVIDFLQTTNYMWCDGSDQRSLYKMKWARVTERNEDEL